MIRTARWSFVALHAKLLAAALLLSCASAPAGQIYKWTDENGEVHYTDTPPPGTKVTPVQIEENVIQEGTPSAPAANQPRPGVPASTPAASQPPGGRTAAPAGSAGLTPEQAAYRQRRIVECERNNGVDCAHQVDMQLRAEHLEPVSGPDGDLAQRRRRMIERCQANNGMDCEHQVDRELDAERLQREGVIHNAPR